MVTVEKYDRLVRMIYDAALNDGGWDDVVVAMSDLLGCIQGTIELHDVNARISEYAVPLCDQSFHTPFQEYYRHLFSLSGRSQRFGVGQIYTSADLGADDAFRRGAYWNEWWLPQGTGGATLMANVARQGSATASVTVYKPFGANSFHDDERAAFGGIVDHLIRGVAIHRQLRLSALATRVVAGPHMAAGCVVVTPDGRIVMADERSLDRLREAALLLHDMKGGHVRSDNGQLERLVADACRTRGARAGDMTVRVGTHVSLAIRVVPCPHEAMKGALMVHGPHAMLCLSDPDARRRAIADRLVRDHGLTPAEALVAVELSQGDGRRAAADRLGIRETTVRAHLSAVFDKLDLHRQAELTHFLANF